MISFANDWQTLLQEEFASEYYQALRSFLKKEYQTQTVYPPMHDIYNALHYTSCADTKVVLLGQDPYHGEGQAHGLCFSVKEGVDAPPSLVNIYKEIAEEFGVAPPTSTELTGWAKQGVLLLNTTLTVRQGQPQSHKGYGWERLTDAIISLVNQHDAPTVFLLWGSHARTKKELITNPRHLILECAHPSPLSAYRGFFGCGHFQKANAFLRSNGRTPIDWLKTTV